MSTHPHRNYYQVLGIDRAADADTIKSAYRNLVRRYHPDLNPADRDAEIRLREINEAYAVLIDPDQRQAYESRIYPSAPDVEWQDAPMAASAPPSNGIHVGLDIGRCGISIHVNESGVRLDLQQLLRDLARDLE